MTFRPADRLRNVRKTAVRRLYDSAPPGSINLGLGEPDFRTPDVVRHEAIRSINEDHTGYTANAGLAELRKLIGSYHSESSRLQFGPDSVCVMNGSEEALFCVLMAMVGPGDEVLLPDPGFLAYPTIAEMAGARVTRYRLPAAGGFAFDQQSFENALTDKTRLVFVHSPSNPTGKLLTREDLHFISRRLDESAAYLISDEIYRDLYYRERPASISEFSEKTVIISGLSKNMSMTGWRLGWAVGPEEVLASVTIMHQYVSTCASVVSQKAAISAFSDEGRRATAGMREELGNRREVMMREIETKLGLPYVAGEGAFYLMLDISQFGSSEDVAVSLLSEGVITAPGSAFGSEGEGYLRLSFSIAAPLIQEGIARIGRWLSTAEKHQ